MAIAVTGASGTGASSSSSSSFTLATATNSFAAGDFAILRVVTENISTFDGATDDHRDISGWTGIVQKLGEQTNNVSGASTGSTISHWLLEATGTINTGTTLTISLSGNTTDKAAALHKLTKAAGTRIRAPIGSQEKRATADASATPGSLAYSSLASASRLYWRSVGVEGNSTTSLTNSTNFTALATVRSRNNASAVYTAGEYRINTSTGETSNPTIPTTSDSASLFIALEEYTPASAGVTTWNPSDKGASVTLVDNNLGLYGSNTANSSGGTRGTVSKASGKSCWRFIPRALDTGNSTYIGVANSTTANTTRAGVSDSNGIVLNVDRGGALYTYYNGAFQSQVGTWEPGDYFDVLWDADNSLCWFLKNGTALFGDPVAGTGGLNSAIGVAYPYAWVSNQGVGYADFTQAGPTGFGAWDASSGTLYRGARAWSAAYVGVRSDSALYKGSGVLH
jgi:hypothetical protein